MVRKFAPEFTSEPPFKLDERVILFSVAVALFSVLLFGLAPAFRTTRADLTSVMKGAAQPRSRGWFRKRPLFSRMWGRNLLVTGQVAISVLLLTVSGAIYAAFDGLLGALKDQGFQTDHVLTANFDPVLTHYKPAQAQQFYEQLLNRLRSASGTKGVTLGSAPEPAAVRPEGYSLPASVSDIFGNGNAARQDPTQDSVTINTVWTEAGYFEALGISILQGRDFNTADSAGAPAVAIVNEMLAKHYWPGQSALGKRMRMGGNDPGHPASSVQIVGVSPIKGFQGIIQVPAPDLIFLPAAQNPKHPLMALFARSEGDTGALAGSLRSLVRELDPMQATPEIHNLQYLYEAFEKGCRLVTQVIGAMGVMGMALALVGLYGLVAYDVNTRTREIGIRMALGAPRGKVLRMVLRQGLVLAACGIAVGLLLNYGAAHLLISLFPTNINSSNGEGFPIVFGWPLRVLALTVVGLTILAAYLPARRAARVDPNVALRCE
jgi:putative ABC transport system permease protein